MIILNNYFVRKHNRMKDIFENKKYFLCISSILFLYLAVRIVTWNNTVLLEDTDSLYYLSSTEAYLSLDLDRINSLNSDSTPFYPLFSALFSSPGWSIEYGARLCSLIFSLLLFFAVIGISSKVADNLTVLVSLVILSLSPTLIPLSISVWTEPSYIAVVYAGMWLFFAQYRDPEYWKSALLGIIFAAAFLNRTEGILFLVILPFLQGLHYFIGKNRKYNLKHYLVWCSIFVSVFSLLATPQILHVSSKMGSLALNGRVAWQALMSVEDGKSDLEKIFGLDYSDSVINIKYARKHYQEIPRDASLSVSRLIKKAKNIIINFNNIYQNILGKVIGPFGFIFVGFGMLSLYASKRRLELLFIFSFIALNLVAPLVHSSVSARHVFIIVPIIYILEGIGIVFLVNFLVKENRGFERFRRILPAIFTTILVLATAHTLKNVIVHPKKSNMEYDPDELREPMRIIGEISANESINRPIIVSERRYISYYSGSGHFYIPFTDYPGLVKYLRLNNADFLYLSYRRLGNRPFLDEFSNNSIIKEFELLYRKPDSRGMPIELYRFKG